MINARSIRGLSKRFGTRSKRSVRSIVGMISSTLRFTSPTTRAPTLDESASSTSSIDCCVPSLRISGQQCASQGARHDVFEGIRMVDHPREDPGRIGSRWSWRARAVLPRERPDRPNEAGARRLTTPIGSCPGSFGFLSAIARWPNDLLERGNADDIRRIGNHAWAGTVTAVTSGSTTGTASVEELTSTQASAEAATTTWRRHRQRLSRHSGRCTAGGRSPADDRRRRSWPGWRRRSDRHGFARVPRHDDEVSDFRHAGRHTLGDEHLPCGFGPSRAPCSPARQRDDLRVARADVGPDAVNDGAVGTAPERAPAP